MSVCFENKYRPCVELQASDGPDGILCLFDRQW